jgi:hypothetical protein
MSLETDALDAASLAATNQTIAANALKDAINILTTAYVTTKNKVDTGLNLVSNTADADKPISLASIAEFLKYVKTSNLATINGQPLNTGLALVIQRSATSLNKVSYDDRGTLRSLSPQLDDSTVIENIGLFVWINTKLEPDDDETCFTTATGQWLLRCPSWDLIDAWNLHEQSITDDWREDEAKRFATYLINK